MAALVVVFAADEEEEEGGRWRRRRRASSSRRRTGEHHPLSSTSFRPLPQASSPTLLRLPPFLCTHTFLLPCRHFTSSPPAHPPIWLMGSLKRKNASLGASAASNKRPARDDTCSAVANGHAGRRSSLAPSSTPSSLGSATAPMSATMPTLETTCNGVSVQPKTCEDPYPSTSASSLLDVKSVTLKDLVITDKECIHPTDSQDQEADTVIVPLNSLNSSNLGPLTPNHAGWFSWNSIHAVEQRGLPEFFNSKCKLKTPTFYIEHRNLLMRKYLENPDKVFTLADVDFDQKGGQLEAVKRIFEFLNHWGLVNSRALQHAEAEKPRKSKSSVVENTSGQPQWSLTSSLYRFDNRAMFHSSRNSAIVERVATTAVMTEPTATDLQGGAQGMPVEYHCNSCSADCSKKRFHCQKQADFDLCPECYTEEKFSIGITNTDFILMEAVTDANRKGGWSDQETLLLLEALEMFGDNFGEIAEHVGTKTKAQCILHFIRLPIEDPFLEAVEPNIVSQAVTTTDSTANPKCSTLASQGDDHEENSVAQLDISAQQEDSISVSGNEQHTTMPDSEESLSAINAIMAAAKEAGLFASDKQLALSECGNPVMTLVAFLAALVEPDTVAKSAQASLKVLADHASALQLADENSFHLELESLSTDSSSLQPVNRLSEEAPQSGPQSDTEDMPDVGEQGKDYNDKGIVNNELYDVTKPSSLIRLKNAAGTALGSAAVKAKFLADQEEWEILRLSAFVVDSQTKKIETKLKLFRELDTALEKEHKLLDRSRERLLSERLQITATRAVQSSVSTSGHYPNTNSFMVGGPSPHSMSSVLAGFASAPPGPMRPPRTSGPTDFGRGPPVMHHGSNMAPMRPVYHNNRRF